MTENDWNACNDPQKMLEFLSTHGSDRKLRLFACACARRHWELLPDDSCRCAVEISEQFADGQASKDDLEARLVGGGTSGGSGAFTPIALGHAGVDQSRSP